MAHDAQTDPRLTALLAGLEPLGSQREEWPGGIVLDIAAYSTERVPPLDLVSGVRAVLRRGDAVLVFDDPLGTHILPGGRIEAGEDPLTALVREIREECDCAVATEPRFVGFIRFRHATTKPDGYRNPYPDFVHLIYVADTTDDAIERTDEPWVQRPRFVPLAELDALPLTPRERALLKVL